jgi:hypothetical protein
MLDLIWTAWFEDGTTIQQFTDEEQKIEHSFKEVLDKKDSLTVFSLQNRHTKLIYILNLKTGIFGITSPVIKNDILDTDEDMKNDTEQKYRLIYFRRVSRTFGLDLTEIGDANIVYFLGYQFTDEHNKNHKRLMKIQNDGRFIIN